MRVRLVEVHRSVVYLKQSRDARGQVIAGGLVDRRWTFFVIVIEVTNDGGLESMAAWLRPSGGWNDYRYFGHCQLLIGRHHDSKNEFQLELI